MKDKLGNRSNASAELEFSNTAGWLIGEEGRGIPTIIEMVHSTRLDVANWGVSLMRQAVSQAGWHVANREAFGAQLLDKPLMQNVLADLEIEVETATLMITRLSGAHERMDVDDHEKSFARLATPIAKYWLTKQSNPLGGGFKPAGMVSVEIAHVIVRNFAAGFRQDFLSCQIWTRLVQTKN